MIAYMAGWLAGATCCLVGWAKASRGWLAAGCATFAAIMLAWWVA